MKERWTLRNLFPVIYIPFVDKYPNYEALNYHVWPVCNPARELGKQVGLPVFRFLKDPIIRKYGKRFYEEMEDVAEELEKMEAAKTEQSE